MKNLQSLDILMRAEFQLGITHEGCTKQSSNVLVCPAIGMVKKGTDT